ncbi:hypothetical protein [Devosia sp. RR2S18]|uniref:hypothetical protein n=1 Tax=Devosia rhizosphaerae TaxID=3049774 RepID=UPI00253F9339|nr:hypothetical protein [Devosia sp. RR2S18]WIJ23927.1 hypothetical protein QOV41_12860 [Devosia sp. RR2S18]
MMTALGSRNLRDQIWIAAMWVFLAPLIVFLGLLDILTEGRSRNWPLSGNEHEGGQQRGRGSQDG